MTAREMQIAFMREISAINQSLELPNLPDSDTIFYFINLEQDRYLKETYISKSSVKDNVELINKKLNDLAALVTRKRIYEEVIPLAEPSVPIAAGTIGTFAVTINNDNSIALPTPADYFYYIRSSSKITGTYLSSSTKSWVGNKIIDQQDLPISIFSNAYNAPIIRNPYIVLEHVNLSSPGTYSDTKMSLYKDTYTDLYNVDLLYIRNPKTIKLVVTNTDTQTTICELPVSTHAEIVSQAARMFIEEYKYKLSTKQ